MNFLEQLAARRRFGMRPGLSTIRAVCRSLGDPQERIKAVHIAGTNGKGSTSANIAAPIPTTENALKISTAIFTISENTILV